MTFCVSLKNLQFLFNVLFITGRGNRRMEKIT